MDAKVIHELDTMLCGELEKIVSKRDISRTSLENIESLTTSILNLLKIKEREESGYSYDGGWNASGTYSNGMNRGNSYNGYSMNNNSYGNEDTMSGRMHYVRGHYSRAEDERSMLADRIEGMIDEGNMSQNEERTLRKAIEVMRR